MQQQFSREIGGRTLIIETGKLAGQAAGACTVRYGDTVVLGTAVMSAKPREGGDFLPLMVDYEERLYAAGKIKGSRFIKREGRPTDEAILTARMIDRTLRPLFDKRIRHDIQVILTVLSVDQENDPDIPSFVAAATALTISDIPWNGPVTGIRIGRINGEWVVNPTYEARTKSELDLVVGGSAEQVVMIEAGAKEVTESTVIEAIDFSLKHLRPVLDLIGEVAKAVGASKRTVLAVPSAEEAAAAEKLETKISSFLGPKIRTLIEGESSPIKQKAGLKAIGAELDQMLKADNGVSKEARQIALTRIDEFYEAEARRLILESSRRVDGRGLDDIRSLEAEVAVLPRTHGSGLFRRGDTQVLSIVTLGSPGDEQFLDTMEETGRKRFMHHYNFPPFSVGEVSPIRSASRREIGHGALVEKAIEPLMPSKEEFPYTIRVVSEVLSSNGSTSQASTCGSTLALMDAGVPLKKPVGGIAMGLIYDKASGQHQIITDLAGVEDFGGNMDFKVAGTREGITAIQLDIKLDGISQEIVAETLERARAGRMKILDVMAGALPAPRTELSPYAPRIVSLTIDPEKIRTVIGKGGETINKIIEDCGGAAITKIDIEQDGLVMVTSTNAEMGEKALATIKNLTREIEVGEVFEGTVMQIMADRNTGAEIGAIVELIPGHDGMVHISEFSADRIPSVSDIVKVGDKLKVKVIDVDKERGRTSLSVRALTGESRPSRPHGRPDRPFGHGGGHGGFNRPPRHGSGQARRPFHGDR